MPRLVKDFSIMYSASSGPEVISNALNVHGLMVTVKSAILVIVG